MLGEPRLERFLINDELKWQLDVISKVTGFEPLH